MTSEVPNWLFYFNILPILIDILIVVLVYFASQKKAVKPYGKTMLWSFTLFFGSWFLLTTVLAEQGIFEPSITKFNSISIALPLGVLVSYFLFTRLKIFKILVSSIPKSWLVLIQFYRAFGAVFLILYGQNLLPPQFALPAGIGDVIVGVSALFVSWSLYNNKIWAEKVTKWWCYLGILDLLVAITMGTLTIPSNTQSIISPFEPTNYLLGKYPLVMIPIFIVPFSITLHLLVLRKLNKQEL
jgi:hypothetical protein